MKIKYIKYPYFMKRLKYVLVALLLLLTNVGVYAQRASVSTDVLKWTTLSPNISVELMLSSRTTLNIESSINPFGEFGDDLQLTHVALSPEFRFWLMRPQHSHFFGVNVLASAYNLKINSFATEGQMIAVGLTYGYSFILSDRLSLTPTVGYGYGMTNNIKDSSFEFKPMVTKLGVGFTYIIN